MKILHTADIHIQQVGDDRWRALETILTVARQRKVQTVVISGDLFDASYHADQVRGEIRRVFQQFNGRILIIPGNHDYAAFADGYFWGNNTHVFMDASHPLEIDGVYFWGIPYFEANEAAVADLVTRLDEQARAQNDHAPHVLLFHGELLDISGHFDSYGETLTHYYMPVQLTLFKGKVWQYILAGHFHTNYHALQFEKDKFFVYPGSPISITRKETQPRRVNLFKLGDAPGEVVLETPYYHPIHIALSPQDSWSDVVTLLQDRLHELPPYSRPLLRISGTFDSHQVGKTETDLLAAIQNVFPQIEIDAYTAIDIHRLLGDELYSVLQQKIDRQSHLTPEQRRELQHYLIQLMMEAEQ